MNSSSVRYITLGCKVNQYETQAMRESLSEAGLSAWNGKESNQSVDFVVINTCTVTSNADKENLYWIRRARREHPGAKIVVTGCMAERNGEQLKAIKDVDLLISNYHKADIAAYLTESCSSPALQDAEHQRLRKRVYAPLTISETQGGGRAFVKIQDGCNHACSFCKVVLVRGRSRSRDLEAIVDEGKRLRDAGYRELVFAGIQLGAYGDDLGLDEGLSRVLEACSEIEGIERLRLSSIEPTDVSPQLIKTMSQLPKSCSQMHIPLQSGDDDILHAMNRRYTRSFYRDLVSQLRTSVPGFMLTLDVMVGFPGETDGQFQNTVDLLESITPLKCHVFPYSRRDGTRAAVLTDVDNAVLKSRVQSLMVKSDVWSQRVRKPYLNQTVSVLVESCTESGLLQGLTSNYFKVCFPGPEEWIGAMRDVDLLHLENDLFLGRSVQDRDDSERILSIRSSER